MSGPGLIMPKGTTGPGKTLPPPETPRSGSTELANWAWSTGTRKRTDRKTTASRIGNLMAFSRRTVQGQWTATDYCRRLAGRVGIEVNAFPPIPQKARKGRGHGAFVRIAAWAQTSYDPTLATKTPAWRGWVPGLLLDLGLEVAWRRRICRNLGSFKARPVTRITRGGEWYHCLDRFRERRLGIQ